MTRIHILMACGSLALGSSTPAAAQALVLDFDNTLHVTNGFQVTDTNPFYYEGGFQIEMLGGDNLGNWGNSSSNFLESPTLAAGSSGTWLELSHASGNLFSVESIDILDFLASHADENAADGSQVTFYGTQADSTVLNSTFTFSTAAYDRELFSFGSEFTNLTSFAWNQNSTGSPFAGATANRAHQVDNLAVTVLGPMPVQPPTIVTLGDSTTAPRSVGATFNGRPSGLSTAGRNSPDLGNLPHNFVDTVTSTSDQLYVYSDQLRDQLTAAMFSFEAVDNEGIGGNRTDQGLARLHGDVQAKGPEIVIIQYGINDSWIDDASVAESPGFDPADGDDGNSRLDVSEYRANLDVMVEALTDDGVWVILMSPNMQGSAYEAQDSLAPDFRNLRMEQFVLAMEDVFAEAEGEGRAVAYIDVWQMYADHAAAGGDIDDWLLDGQHPNAVGHELIADELFAVITIPEPSSLASLLSAGLILLHRRRHPVPLPHSLPTGS